MTDLEIELFFSIQVNYQYRNFCSNIIFHMETYSKICYQHFLVILLINIAFGMVDICQQHIKRFTRLSHCDEHIKIVLIYECR